MGNWTISIHHDSDFSLWMNRAISRYELSVHVTSLTGNEGMWWPYALGVFQSLWELFHSVDYRLAKQGTGARDMGKGYVLGKLCTARKHTYYKKIFHRKWPRRELRHFGPFGRICRLCYASIYKILWLVQCVRCVGRGKERKEMLLNQEKVICTGKGCGTVMDQV